MKVDVKLSKEKLREISRTFLVLSNVKRLRLLLLLKELKPSSSAEIHQEAKKEGIYENRETTYRALEDLTKTKLVSKYYDEEKKELVYAVKK